MNISKRFEDAIRKLYEAFHNNTINPECCKQCAVGNILDNTDSWKHLSDDHGSLELNYVGKVHQAFGRKFGGYTPLEILKIEAVFLEACGYELPFHHKNKRPDNPRDKEILFNGLSAVIEYLCKLEGIQNIMDYSKLFDYENNQPKYALVV
ncbi:Na(+)-translocating NADH-quinone reductase subunit F [Kordia sp. TARA_039_SRF]|nr:Na(+)-translocating NADH-quinone reductase subunit F [Kordia sp. TARA_039_SRF]